MTKFLNISTDNTLGGATPSDNVVSSQKAIKDYIDGTSSGCSVDILDFKFSDYLLTDMNWLRADTFSWHDGTVYTNIYDHLVADMTSATQKTFRFETEWTQPIATGETTTTDLGDVVIKATSQYSGRQGYKAFNGVKSGTTSGDSWTTNNTSAVATLTVSFPYKLRITAIRGYKPHLGTPTNGDTIGQFYADTAKTIPIGNQYVNAGGAPSWTIVDVSGIPADGIITDTLVFEKTGGGNYGGFGELEITATRVLQEGSFTVYEATDGHIIAPYTQDAIDGLDYLYTTNGVAWIYILDTTNERFILPRTKWGVVGYRDKVGGTVNVGTAGSDIKASQMYLYFYGGGFSQSAVEQTAGLNASLFDGKLDTTAQNLTSEGKKALVGLPFASTRHDTLTLGATETTYTAPANGYFVINKTSSGSGQRLAFINRTSDTQYSVFSTGNGQALALSIPAAKGDVVEVRYTLGAATNVFEFVYAIGET